jgi:putative transposase
VTLALEQHHRRSIRLPGYDYSQVGAYFVTVCSYQKECVFGEVVKGEMRLNEAGREVLSVWEVLPQRFPSIELDAFVVMPNHIHGIIMLIDTYRTANVGARSPRPDSNVVPYIDKMGAGTAPILSTKTDARQHRGLLQISIHQTH